MRHLIAGFVLFLLMAGCALAMAQEVFDGGEYTIKLPQTWKVLSEGDDGHEHAEFVNGDRLEGYLQIRKEVVDAGTTPSDLVRRDLDQKLRFLPGFIEGKEEKFSGHLNGVTASYEFIKNAKPMMGRIYYLQADNRTIYSFRFSGARDKLARIRNQTDMIARSFQLK
ncbi:MAG: hypothetical protein ABJC10_13740 [Acidobacteriota bacterium]